MLDTSQLSPHWYILYPAVAYGGFHPESFWHDACRLFDNFFAFWSKEMVQLLRSRISYFSKKAWFPLAWTLSRNQSGWGCPWLQGWFLFLGLCGRQSDEIHLNIYHTSNIYITYIWSFPFRSGVYCVISLILIQISFLSAENPNTTPALPICFMLQFTHRYFRITMLMLLSPTIVLLPGIFHFGSVALEIHGRFTVASCHLECFCLCGSLVSSLGF